MRLRVAQEAQPRGSENLKAELKRQKAELNNALKTSHRLLKEKEERE